MKKLLAPILLMAGWMLQGAAYAGIVSVSSDLNMWGDWTSNMGFKRFDPQLGQLQEVRFNYSADFDSRVDFSNPHEMDVPFTLRLGGIVSLDLPIDDELSVIVGDQGTLGSLEQGQWAAMTFKTYGQSRLTTGLEAFIGAGDWRMGLTGESLAGVFGFDGIRLEAFGTTRVAVNVSVDYVYKDLPATQPGELPEPATLPLAGLALVGAVSTAGLRRRRR